MDRCPLCAWELTDDGRCTSCAYEFDNGYPFSDSASLTVSDITEGEDDSFFMGDELELFDTLYPDTLSPLEESPHRRITHLGNLNRRLPPITSAEVGTRASHMINTPDHHASRSRFRPDVERSYFRTITDDELGDTDDDTSEEDDLGSLRDFVVNDGETEDGNRTQLSPRSSHYDSDEATGIFEALGSYSTDDHFDNQGDNDVSQGNTTSDSKPGSSANSSNIISIEDDDSDEGPVLRSRTRAYRRSVASPESDGIAGYDLPPITRMPPSTGESRRQGSEASTTLHHQRNSQTSTVSESSSTVSRAISNESDSGSSPVIRRTRTTQGRSAPSHIISDDEDDAATVSSGNTSALSRQSSSGTMTIGRRSPARLDPGNQEDLAIPGRPINISSSPGRLNALAFQ